MNQFSDAEYNQILKDFDSYGKVLLEAYQSEEGKVKKEKAFVTILNYFKLYENRKGVKNLSPKEKDFLNEITFIIDDYEEKGGSVFNNNKTFLNAVSKIYNKASYYIPTAMATVAVVFAAYQINPKIVKPSTETDNLASFFAGWLPLPARQIAELYIADSAALIIGTILSTFGLSQIPAMGKYIAGFFSEENAQDEKYLQMIRERKERFLLANK